MNYPASPIKRVRATKAEMEERRAALYAIVSEMRPMTVRQIFYQASVRGLIEKTEGGYDKIQSTLSAMRWSGEISFDWIADATRWVRKPRTFTSVEQAIAYTAQTYRRSLWADADVYLEIWLEKDALAGVVIDITDDYDVPLMVAKGYSSLSFLHSAAEVMATKRKPCHVYHFGDHDPSGVNAGAKINETLCRLAPNADIRFARIAVTEEMIEHYKLPSRPTKTSDSRSKSWTGGDSVELDALPPNELRALVEGCILMHVDRHALRLIEVAEASERTLIKGLVGMLEGQAP